MHMFSKGRQENQPFDAQKAIMEDGRKVAGL